MESKSTAINSGKKKKKTSTLVKSLNKTWSPPCGQSFVIVKRVKTN